METQLQYINMVELTVSSVATLLGVFLSWFLKYKYGEYKQKRIDREISHSKLIQTILDQLLEEYNCQRAFILQRHNGGKYKVNRITPSDVSLQLSKLKISKDTNYAFLNEEGVGKNQDPITGSQFTASNMDVLQNLLELEELPEQYGPSYYFQPFEVCNAHLAQQE